MSRRQKYDRLKNTFPFPNDVFLLGLCPGELAVYAYLLRCESRKTHQCWPSCKTIGKAVKMSENIVRKYVCSLADKDLIHTENTSVMTRDGLKRNCNLLCTILLIQLALDRFYKQLLARMDLEIERQRAAKALALRGDKEHSA